MAIVPSLSLALAVSVMVAGAVAIASFDGLVSVTAGAVLGGGGPAGVTVTWSKVAVAVTPATWLDTARPTSAVAPSVKVSLATTVQVTPSADS